jgi:hypothetical protein
LEWANGAVNTPGGPLSVRWHIDQEHLEVKIKAPKGVKVDFIENDTHKNVKVSVELTYLP